MSRKTGKGQKDFGFATTPKTILEWNRTDRIGRYQQPIDPKNLTACLSIVQNFPETIKIFELQIVDLQQSGKRIGDFVASPIEQAG